MIRIITRHGQIAKNAEYVGGHMYPKGEHPLSDLGREQAQYLGERLKAIGFKGRIISSPYMRTLETAEIIAQILDTTIIPFAPIREIFKFDEQAIEYKGMTMEEIRQRYTHIDPEATLAYPWWLHPGQPPHGESEEEVQARVDAGVRELEERFPNEELLMVGHGASSWALLHSYGIEADGRKLLFNCSFSMIDPQNESVHPVYCDTSHMPYEKTASNFLFREQFDADYFAAAYEDEITLPDGVASIEGMKILHIGDTHSERYPYYKKLIELVKPDVILHTGDMADEVKVGRIPGTQYEYLSKIKVLTQMLKDSGARLIVVPGNNDLPEEIAQLLPTAEIYPENTILTLDGVECRIGHKVHEMTFDKVWSFYGHGPTGDNWRLEDNEVGCPCRFNAFWGSYVYCLSEGKFFHLPLPKMKTKKRAV